MENILFIQESNLFYRIVDDQTLLINAITNKFHRINPVGTQILSHFKQPSGIEQVFRSVRESIPTEEIGSEDLYSDIENFIDVLIEEKIIRHESQSSQAKRL